MAMIAVEKKAATIVESMLALIVEKAVAAQREAKVNREAALAEGSMLVALGMVAVVVAIAAVAAVVHSYATCHQVAGGYYYHLNYFHCHFVVDYHSTSFHSYLCCSSLLQSRVPVLCIALCYPCSTTHPRLTNPLAIH
jgi:hypothetical protein